MRVGFATSLLGMSADSLPRFRHGICSARISAQTVFLSMSRRYSIPVNHSRIAIHAAHIPLSSFKHLTLELCISHILIHYRYGTSTLDVIKPTTIPVQLLSSRPTMDSSSKKA